MTNEEMAKLAETDARARSNSKRIDKLEERQDNLDKLISAVAVMGNKQEKMEDDIKEIKVDVKSLTGKPGKRWEAVVEKLLLVVLTAVVAFILAKIGL